MLAKSMSWWDEAPFHPYKVCFMSRKKRKRGWENICSYFFGF